MRCIKQSHFRPKNESAEETLVNSESVQINMAHCWWRFWQSEK
ncbi:hypothetical protein HMPREF1604_01561 [Escherichia coli 908519]|nr:hypothetical protein HMPREF1604_01561 [Escherichia coli 908519]UMW91760.1 hypothetical protein [Escherichia coli]UNS24948.1 hypothetical protein [Escherichia coli]WDZ04001.1 hypothetical protein [Escherichia coli]